MNKRTLLHWLFFIGGVIFLFPSFHRNQFQVVEPEYYRLWERTYDRVVIARVAMSQQHGVFSSAGLLGLANLEENETWNFSPDRQFEIYENEEPIIRYRVYRSHPGFQGYVFSFIDGITNFSPSQNIEIFRGIVSLFSAITISLLSTFVASEFGLLSGLLILVFSSLSEWMILPGGNMYWNLWAFYIPFLIGVVVLHDESSKNRFNTFIVFSTLFIAILIKILFTGFEMITTVLVMTTVPFVYYAVLNKWGAFWKRLMYLGVALSLATLLGLVALVAQIAWNDGNFKSPIDYILRTLDRRALGDPNNFRGQSYDESLQASDLSVIRTYLNINAFNSQTPQRIWQKPYWEIIVFFTFCTILFLVRRWPHINKKEVALITATWYSLAAPISWYVVFTPTSYIHTFLFPMAWQMPFTLLGFALCGYVIEDLFKKRSV